MKDCNLIVVFNYSACCINKQYLEELYSPYFNKVIFYSDLPATNDTDINFIDINRGYNTLAIFNHYHATYKEKRGLFYTMDDNIINLNILHQYTTDKIIYPYHKLSDFHTHNEEWWNTIYGKQTVLNLINDPDWEKFGITQFSGGDGYVGFSDFFYIPPKYLTETLFELFGIFSKHKVFLEIAMPTIINNIEKEPNNYHTFSYYNAWPNRNFYLDKANIYSSINKDFHLFLHPIKFNQNQIAKEWLTDILCKQKCVIITTINEPTEAVLKHISNKDYDVIIVGDIKTPSTYKTLDGIFLDIDAQRKLFPTICELIPYNHYSRKNLGYLFAINKGYKIIYETDDDNIPFDNFDNILSSSGVQMLKDSNKFINIFKYFTNDCHIWPRGYPLSQIKTETNFIESVTNVKPSIITGLVENDPDVDAIFRLTNKAEVIWDKGKKVIVSNENICLFNTQNTFWVDSEIFKYMLIPSTVSFRYCDILRGIICNLLMKDKYIMYTSPNVVQNRNFHNLISDFKSEYEMYIHNETISETRGNSLKQIYMFLIEKGVMKYNDFVILDQWLKILNEHVL